MRSPFIVTYNPDWRRRDTSSAQAVAVEIHSNIESDLATPQSDPIHTRLPEIENGRPVSAEPQTPLATSSADLTPKIVRFKMPMPTNSNKLVKKGRPTPSFISPTAPPATNPSSTPEPGPSPDMTPDTAPERKKSIFSRFNPKGKSIHADHNTYATFPTTNVEEAGDDGPTWKHHESYFPEYTPIYPTTTFADPYATAYLLTPAEVQAQQHAANVGRAIAVHYPMLPPFADYSSAKGQGAWQSGQWGNRDWTGFGLNGEKLPDAEGKTFGAPMPKGVPNGEPVKGKGKAGGDGGEGGKAEGGGDAEAAGGAGGDGAGGGGGGKKGKGKK